MPAALHILRIKIGGWKAIREDNPVEIDFQGGKKFASSALIVGPNESGKSSLFSALRFALFEKFDRRGVMTKNWVNHGSDEAKIEVDILINGENYSIIKTRKSSKGGTSALYHGTGTDKEILLRGPDADSKILELLGASWKSSNTKEELPSNWGLLAWLLAPQGMDSVNPARESGTETLGLNRVMSPELSILQDTLIKANASELNDNMTPKKHGKYWEASQEEKNLLSDINELTNKSEAFSDLMENIQKCNTKIEDLKRKEEEAQNEYDAVLGDHSDSEPLLETNLESLKSKAKAQDLNKIELSNELKTLTDLEAELSEARIELTKSIESESALRSELDRVILEQQMQDLSLIHI